MWNAVPSMAANSSSCARVREAPAERDAAQFGIHQHGAVAVVPGEPQQAGLAGAVAAPGPRESSATVVPARRAMASKISPVAESPASMPVQRGMDRARHHAAHAGDQAALLADGHDAGGGAHHVDHVAQPHAGADGVPVRVERAHRESGMPGAQPELLRPLGGEVAGDLVRGLRSGPPSLPRTPASSGSTAARNSSGGRPPSAAFHIHLWPMAQTLRGTSAGSVMPHSTAATMSQCSSAVAKRARFSGLWRSQCSSLAKPHSEE